MPRRPPSTSGLPPEVTPKGGPLPITPRAEIWSPVSGPVSGRRDRRGSAAKRPDGAGAATCFREWTDAAGAGPPQGFTTPAPFGRLAVAGVVALAAATAAPRTGRTTGVHQRRVGVPGRPGLGAEPERAQAGAGRAVSQTVAATAPHVVDGKLHRVRRGRGRRVQVRPRPRTTFDTNGLDPGSDTASRAHAARSQERRPSLRIGRRSRLRRRSRSRATCDRSGRGAQTQGNPKIDAPRASALCCPSWDANGILTGERDSTDTGGYDGFNLSYPTEGAEDR